MWSQHCAFSVVDDDHRETWKFCHVSVSSGLASFEITWLCQTLKWSNEDVNQNPHRPTSCTLTSSSFGIFLDKTLKHKNFKFKYTKSCKQMWHKLIVIVSSRILKLERPLFGKAPPEFYHLFFFSSQKGVKEIWNKNN